MAWLRLIVAFALAVALGEVAGKLVWFYWVLDSLP